MNKKTIYLILVVPFVIALLGFTNVLLIKNFVEVDISDIKRKYNEVEGFKISNEGYLLEAEGVVPDGLKVSEGNALVWTINENDNVARVEEKNGQFYLKALNEGEVVLTCSNEKKTKSKSFDAVIYDSGTIIINPKNKGSGYSVTKSRNFGEFDISYSSLMSENVKKNKALFSFTVQEFPSTENTLFKIDEKSDNIDVSFEDNQMNVKVKESGEAFVRVRSVVNDFLTTTYKINIIDNGVNVYNYKDLMMCTNKSEHGEIVCLQTSLGSKENTYNADGTYKESNIRLFGNEDGLDFKNEVYTFDSTYNTEYIKQIYGSDTNYDDVITGIRVQKDFYGNGFYINGRELTYPNNGKINQYSGKLEPGEKDLFKGPLTFFSIGQFKAPIMKAFGQDNSLMYIDGDNIIVDDLIIECTDRFNNEHGDDTSSNNMYNLEYTGTAVDVRGKNVTIKNSELRNARTALRVYSSDNFVLDNSLISTAREFLMKIGCNEYKKIDEEQNVSFTAIKKVFNGKLKKFLNNHTDSKKPYYELSADELIKESFFGKALNKETYNELVKLQKYLDSESDIKQNIHINDTYFYRSGIYSIALDTYFNGPFLYNGLPSFIIDAFESIVPPGTIQAPNNISGTMYGTLVDIQGDTRFYDWKDIDSLNVSCLIEERLGEFISSIPEISEQLGQIGRINIDEYFPIKDLLTSKADVNNYIFLNNGKKYINTPIAYYGGGENHSIIKSDHLKTNDFGEILDIDVAQNALFNLNSENVVSNILARCVPLASGFNSFKFITNGIFDGKPYLFNEVPDKNDFKERV